MLHKIPIDANGLYDVDVDLSEMKKYINFDGSIDDLKNVNILLKCLDTFSSKFTEYNASQIICGRLLIWIQTQYLKTFNKYLDINKNLFNDSVRNYFIENKVLLEELSKSMDLLNYEDIDYFSAKTMIKNYFIKSNVVNIALETPVYMYIRVATQLYHNTENSFENITKVATELAKKYYIPSSPTLFNSGLKKHQLSSCFLINIEDDFSDISNAYKNSSIISSCGGGVGVGVGKLRHSEISECGESNGILPICRVFDKIADFANQSGKRRGAFTNFTYIWHIDVTNFIESTKPIGTDHRSILDTANTCLWVNDLFFERVRCNGYWTLFCPNKAIKLINKYGLEFEKEYLEYEKIADEQKEVSIIDVNNFDIDVKSVMEMKLRNKQNLKYVRVKAVDLLNKIIQSQISSGMPYICNSDNINMKNNQMNIGCINSSNLCLEIMEATPPCNTFPELEGYVGNTIASCNLSSLNLSLFLDKTKNDVDYDNLGTMTMSCIRNLNRVVDNNYYPLDKKDKFGNVTKVGRISALNKKAYPIGLGVSGYSDLINRLKIIPCSDKESITNRKIFACIYFNALAQSVFTAKDEGSYGYFDTSEFTYLGKTYQGSPAKNGLLQFDFWKMWADKKKELGKLSKHYDESLDIPIDPTEWNQKVLTYKDIAINPSWDSLKEAIKNHGLKNSLLIALMPTASSAQVLRNAESTEFHQRNVYTRSVQSGMFNIFNRWLIDELSELGIWNLKTSSIIVKHKGNLNKAKEDLVNRYPELEKEISDIVVRYPSQFDIPISEMIKRARERGIYIDQSQSLNFFTNKVNVTDLAKMHIYANSVGLKTGMYYLRQEVLDTGKWGTLDKNTCKNCE